jgi:hypothetical protein
MKKWVPDRAHRAQLLHLSTGTHISAVLYTQASTIRPLHSLLVEFPDNLCAAWQRLLGHANAKWGLEIPERQADWGTAVDANTVHLHRALRVAMIDLVDRSGEPIPAVDYVKPTVITMWNKLKFLIDGTTRQLKNIQVKDESLGAQMYLLSLAEVDFLELSPSLGYVERLSRDGAFRIQDISSVSNHATQQTGSGPRLHGRHGEILCRAAGKGQ